MTVPTPALAAAAEACPFVNRDALQRALEAAAPLIATAERDRIIALIEAEEGKHADDCPHCYQSLSDIADLITGSTP